VAAAYGIRALNKSSYGKSASSGAKSYSGILRAGLGSVSDHLKYGRDQLIKGFKKDVIIAGERVRLILKPSPSYSKRHPDIAFTQDYYKDPNENDITLMNKYFGSKSEFKEDNPFNICDEAEKARLVQGLTYRLGVVQEEIKDFYNNTEFTVQQVAKINHAQRLISLIKKIERATGKCETLSEEGGTIETPGVDPDEEKKFEDLAKKFAYIVLRHFDPEIEDKGPTKDIIEGVNRTVYDELYVNKYAKKPVFIQRLLGLDGDLQRLLLAEQEKLLKTLLDLMGTTVVPGLDDQVEGVDPTPFDKISKIIGFAVDNYRRSATDIAALNERIAAAEAEKRRLTEELADAADKFTALEKACEEAAAAHAAALAAAEAARVAAITAKGAAEAERDAAIAGTAAAVRDAEAARDAALRQIEEKQRALEAANGERDAANTARAAAEAALRASQDALAAAEAARDAAAADAAAARAELAAKTAELAAKVAELEALQAGQGGAAAANAGLTAELARVRADLDAMTAELAACRAAAAAAAAAARDAAEAAAAELRGAIAARDAAKAADDAADADKNAQVAAIDAHLRRIAELEKAIADLERSHTGGNEELRGKADASNELAIGLQEQLIQAKAALKILEAKLAAAEAAAADAKRELEDCNEARRVLQEQLEALTAKAARDLAAERERTEAELAKLRRNAGIDTEMIKGLTAAAAVHDALIRDLQAQILKLKQENTALHRANQVLTGERDSARKALANPQVAADIKALSDALDTDGPLPHSDQLRTIVQRITELRGNKTAFNKNMCLFSNYVSYFMKLLFSNNEDYDVFARAVDRIKVVNIGGTYLQILEKLDPFLRFYDGAKMPDLAHSVEISSHYKPDPDIQRRLSEKLGGRASSGIDKNDYFALFVVASQKYLAEYMSVRDIGCAVPEAIRNPAGLKGSATFLPRPVASDPFARAYVPPPVPEPEPEPEPLPPRYVPPVAAAPVAATYAAAVAAKAAPRAPFQGSVANAVNAARARRAPPTNNNDDDASFARIRELAKTRASPAPAPEPAPVSYARTGVKGSPGNPWTEPDASTALKTLQTVLKVKKGTGYPPPGSPRNTKQYVRENNRVNQTLLDAYCAYATHDTAICSKYASIKGELNAVSRF